MYRGLSASSQSSLGKAKFPSVIILSYPTQTHPASIKVHVHTSLSRYLGNLSHFLALILFGE